MKLPTTAEMRARLRRVRNDDVARHTIDRLRNGRFALVLSGGGGKGAYEIGALLALRDCGIASFSAIAGTSVGALNASLIAQGGLEDAREVWCGITFGQVLKAHPVGVVIALLLRVLLAPMFVLRSVPSFWEAVTAFRSFERSGFPRPIALQEAVACLVLPFIKYAAVPALLLTGAVSLIGGLRFPYVANPWFWLAALCSLGPMVLLWWGLFKVHNSVVDHFAILSNEPLQSLVRRKLRPREIRAASFPTYITLASLAWQQILPGEEKTFGIVHSLINFKLGYVPIYKDLRELSDDGIREHVVQSGALPEVFPRRAVSGVPVIDGGMADNTPIGPVVDADGLIVIYLQALKDRGSLARSEAARVERIIDIITPSVDDAAFVAALWLVGKEAELDATATDTAYSCDATKPLLAIVPSRSLGGLLTGTMNFSACKARRLMWLGYWDALGALEEGMMEWPWSRSRTAATTGGEVVRLARAAADGDATAQYSLGLRYSLGKGVAQDPAEAVRWFTKAADAGFAAAEMALGTRYLQGSGVPRNPSEGMKWLSKAADGGDANAQGTLGMMYVSGNPLPLNYSEGVKWLKKAAEQGNPVGLAGLGQCFAIGGGVETDLIEAYKLYILAAHAFEKLSSSPMRRAGLEDVRKRIEELRAQITTEQLREGEDRARHHVFHVT